MARYIVSTRDHEHASGAGIHGMSALDAVSGQTGVTVVAGSNPHLVTIDTSPDIANVLERRLSATHIVEPEIRRSLQ